MKTRRVSAAKYRGLGDIVAAVAQPIARLADQHLGTHLVACDDCAARQLALNRRVSFVNTGTTDLLNTTKTDNSIP